MLAAAEVTLVVIVFALRAQWGPLVGCPLLIWQSISGIAIVTEAACHQAAINAWPDEPHGRRRLIISHLISGGEDLDLNSRNLHIPPGVEDQLFQLHGMAGLLSSISRIMSAGLKQNGYRRTAHDGQLPALPTLIP